MLNSGKKFNEVIEELDYSEKLDKRENKKRRQKKILAHNFSLKEITALTPNQKKVFQSFENGKNIFLHGSAGTGKTYLALFLALSEVLSGFYTKILIVRSTVSTRDQGFLPGTLQEKIDIFKQPYKEIVNDLCGRGDAYSFLENKGHIEFTSTSYLRGLTYENCFIILDEVQNFVDHEINSVLTRVGKNCKIMICGDSKQNDLSVNSKKNQESGIKILLAIVKKMESFDHVEFGISDIVRSGFVKEYLLARIELGFD